MLTTLYHKIHMKKECCTVEPLHYGHHWDHIKCPGWRGVLISEVVYILLYLAGTTGSIQIREVSLRISEILNTDIPLLL